MLNTSSVIKTS